MSKNTTSVHHKTFFELTRDKRFHSENDFEERDIESFPSGEKCVANFPVQLPVDEEEEESRSKEEVESGENGYVPKDAIRHTSNLNFNAIRI